MTKKSAWITGYYGRQNVGDEAILSSVIKNCPLDADIRVLVDGDLNSSSKIHNVKCIPTPPFNNENYSFGIWYGRGYWIKHGLRFINDFLQKKICIIAGGGLLNDHVEGRCVTKKNWIHSLRKLGCERTGVLGVGIDSVTLQNDIDAIVDIVHNEVAYFSVRDQESAKILTDLGVSEDKFYVSSDLAYGLEFSGRKKQEKDNLKEAVVGINLRPLFVADNERGTDKLRRGEDYFNNSLRLIKEIETFVKEVRLIAFSPDDFLFLQEFQKIAGVELKNTCGDPNVAMDMVASCDLVVGMRYHSIVLSLISKIPVVPLIYATKSRTLCEELGYNPDGLTIGDGVLETDSSLDIDCVISNLRSTWDNRDRIVVMNNSLVEKKRAAAVSDIQRCWKSLLR